MQSQSLVINVSGKNIPLQSAIHETISQNWELIAAYSYASYLQANTKGCIFMDLDGDLIPGQEYLAWLYVPRTKLREMGTSAETRKVVIRHDPMTQVCFLWVENGGLRVRTFGCLPLPPEAYQTQKENLERYYRTLTLS